MFPNYEYTPVWTYDAIRGVWTDSQGSTVTDAERDELSKMGVLIPSHSTLRHLRMWNTGAQRIGKLGPDPKASRRKYPGECPCGIQSEDCAYHKDM